MPFDIGIRKAIQSIITKHTELSITSFMLFTNEEDFELKALLLLYNHDLENRASFRINYEESNFIKYKENLNITKEEVFSPIREIFNEKILSELEYHYKFNLKFQEFLKFLYYIENEYFLEYFLLVIIALEVDLNRFFIVNFENDMNKEVVSLLSNPHNLVLKTEIQFLKEWIGNAS